MKNDKKAIKKQGGIEDNTLLETTEIFKLWTKAASIGALRDFLKKNGITTFYHEKCQLNDNPDNFNESSKINLSNWQIDIESVKERIYSLLQNPNSNSTNVDPITDGIARLFITFNQINKTENIKRLDKKDLLDRAIYRCSNLFLHFCSYIQVYFFKIYTQQARISKIELDQSKIVNLWTLLIDIYECASSWDANASVKMLLDAVANSNKGSFVKSMRDSKSFPELYLPPSINNSSECTEYYLALQKKIDEHLGSNSLTDIDRLKAIERIYSRRFNQNPIAWNHYDCSKLAAKLHGRWVYINLVLARVLHPAVERLKKENKQEDKTNLANLIKRIQDLKITYLLFSDKEKEERKLFVAHLDALLSMCKDSTQNFDLIAYINSFVDLETKQLTTAESLPVSDNSIKTNIKDVIIRPELTEAFLILLTRHAQKFADPENLKKLVTFGSNKFPESKKIFFECLMQRMKDDKVAGEKKAQKQNHAEEVEQRKEIELAEKASLLKIKNDQQSELEAAERASEAATRRLAAEIYAAEVPEPVMPNTSTSSSSATSSADGGFNHTATWNDGKIIAGNAGIYKVGTDKSDQFKQYVQLPADLISSFGVQIIDNNYIKRAATALGSQGFKTYKTSDDKAVIVEIKSLSANDGGDRIYFTQMLKNDKGETLYTGAVRGKHNANVVCQGA